MTGPVSVLVSCEPDDEIGVEMLGALGGVDVLTYDPNSPLPEAKRHAQILIPPYRSSHRPLPLLEQLVDLRLVQLLSAGADEWAGDVPSHVTLSTARGAHGGPVSEWVLSALLCLCRQWPELVRYQDQETWAHRRVDADTLAGKRVLIVGAGSIGTAVAQKLAPFGADSTLVGRTTRQGVHAVADVCDLLPHHDVVVIAAPLTADTIGLVNSRFLAALPDGAIVVNAARGKIVDTAALTAELRNGRLRAALDVTDPEPLPEGHEMWKCPGVIISPHMARTVPGTNVLCYKVAVRQIQDFLSGGSPANVATPSS